MRESQILQGNERGGGRVPKDGVITFGSVKEKEIEVVVPVIRRLKAAFPNALSSWPLGSSILSGPWKSSSRTPSMS